MGLLRAVLRGLLGGQESQSLSTGRRSTRRAGEVYQAAEPDPSEVIKEPPMEIDGRVMSADEFVAYVEALEMPPPLPTRIFLHHTWRPTRETWRGYDTILGMKAYYERQLWQDLQGRWHEGWTAGPHLFIADDGIWLFSDVRYDGVGVYGHNYRSRHIEMVGDYDAALPSGATLLNTIAALGILHERLGLDIRQLNFHRDFSTKSCPGWAVQKEWIIPQVETWIAAYRAQRSSELSAVRRALVGMLGDLLVGTNPQAALAKEAVARGLLGALSDEAPMEIDGKSYVVQFFADALLVPVNEWDRVQSLSEYEASARLGSEETPLDDQAEEAQDHHVTPMPSDPYDFTARSMRGRT
ncbi:MAG: N-acetylmuramoyl-L-alanine amidase [Anaerolineae bacterium]|nr:N-acetylmuramoyl-L-alanine amidase [Anaerolineae bacterium]